MRPKRMMLSKCSKHGTLMFEQIITRDVVNSGNDVDNQLQRKTAITDFGVMRQY